MCVCMRVRTYVRILLIYLDTAPLAVKTNQSDKPQKKRKDVRRRGVEEDKLERIWARVFTGKQFHKRGPAEAKPHC